MHVLAALPNLVELDLRGCSLLDDSALEVLQQMRKLRSLKLGRQLEVTNAGLDTLATFQGEPLDSRLHTTTLELYCSTST